MNESDNVQEFFSRFEKQISALNDAGENVTPEKKLHCLLMILSNKYSHIVDMLDAMPKENQILDYIKGKVLFDQSKANDV